MRRKGRFPGTGVGTAAQSVEPGTPVLCVGGKMAFSGAFRVGLGEGWKVPLAQGAAQERGWCSQAVAEQGHGGSHVPPMPCPQHPAASSLLLQLVRGFQQCRRETLSPTAAILDLELEQSNPLLTAPPHTPRAAAGTRSAPRAAGDTGLIHLLPWLLLPYVPAAGSPPERLN